MIAGSGYACGLSLLEPKSYFQGADYQGHAYIIEKLGVIQTEQMPKNESIPIYLIFNSGNTYVTSYSGSFDIPLLTSRIEQIDENNFLLRSPTGWILPFSRNSKDKNLLDGSNDMKAEVDESKQIVTVWASCGDRLIFSRGRLIQWKTKDLELDYIYSGNRVSEIRGNGKSVLKVNSNSQTGETTGLSLGLDRTIGFVWGKQPIVENIQGKLIVTEMRKTLSRVDLPNGEKKEFEFSVDSQMHPTLNIDNEQLSWDPESLLVSRAGKWTYSVVPTQGRFANAQINRSNSGVTESWFYNGAKGEEMVRENDGTRKIRYWFINGALDGKLRKISRIKDGVSKDIVACSYDEHGDLLRYRDEVFDCSVDRIKKSLTIIRKGMLRVENTFGKPVTMQRSDQGENLIVFLSDASGNTRQLFIQTFDESRYLGLIQFSQNTKNK